MELGGFLGGSDGKESVCSAGNLGSVSWLGGSPGEKNVRESIPRQVDKKFGVLEEQKGILGS